MRSGPSAGSAADEATGNAAIAIPDAPINFLRLIDVEAMFVFVVQAGCKVASFTLIDMEVQPSTARDLSQ